MASSPDNRPSSPALDPEKTSSSSAKEKALPLTTSDDDAHAVEGGSVRAAEVEDILARQALDPALNLKMHLVNNVSCPFLSTLNVRG